MMHQWWMSRWCSVQTRCPQSSCIWFLRFRRQWLLACFFIGSQSLLQKCPHLRTSAPNCHRCASVRTIFWQTHWVDVLSRYLWEEASLSVLMGPIFFVTTDGNNSRSGSGRLGTGDLTLAELLIPSFLELAKVDPSPTQEAVPNPERLLMCASQYISWLLLGEDGDHPLSFSGRAISLSNILLQYGQYGNLEVIWFEVGKHPVDFLDMEICLCFRNLIV